MIFCSKCRKPHDLASHRGRMFDRVWVDASHDIVEHDAGVDLGAQFRMMFGNERGRHHAAVVVILGHNRREPGGGDFPKQFQVIDATRRDRRAAMDMRIDGAFQQVVDAPFDGCRSVEILHNSVLVLPRRAYRKMSYACAGIG